LNTVGRVKYISATDAEALSALRLCAKLEGIIPALEPAHALAKIIELAPTKARDHLMVVNLCGRGDKDLATISDYIATKCS
jgi:tryptophan synthase beta chain